jgi:multiple sugar transport system substrate-binding protein
MRGFALAHQHSRRSFLIGVGVTGIGSAWAGRLFEGDRSDAPLRVACGEDRSGARDLLIQMWNARNRRFPATIVKVDGSTQEQLNTMRQHAKDGTADLLALDVIHLAEFVANELITPIEAAGPDGFVEAVRTINQLNEKRDDFWALPFNTDCGVMFHRLPPGRDDTDEELPDLTRLLAPKQSATWLAQLPITKQTSGEAFLCNVFEHALASTPEILAPATGKPSTSTVAWANALLPLRDAVARKAALGATGMSNEGETTKSFNEGVSDRMRNWPNQFRPVEAHRHARHGAYQVRVARLPVGVLGGQSLALVARGRYRSAATDLANFLSGPPAQRTLASFGFAPVRSAVYGDEELQRTYPHLPRLRDLIGQAVPRPVHRLYAEEGDRLQTAFRSFLFGAGAEPTFGEGFAETLQRLNT